MSESLKELDMNTLDSDDKLAFDLCEKLAVDLDSGVDNTIALTAKSLLELPAKSVLIGCRHALGIMRAVKYNLDENADFAPVFLVCSEEYAKNEQAKNKDSSQPSV